VALLVSTGVVKDGKVTWNVRGDRDFRETAMGHSGQISGGEPTRVPLGAIQPRKSKFAALHGDFRTVILLLLLLGLFPGLFPVRPSVVEGTT